MARKTNNKNGTTGGSTGSAAAKRSGSRKTGNRSSSSGRKKSASSAGRASSSSRKTGTTSAKKRASAASSRKNAALEKARQEKMLREREIRMDLALLVLLFLTVFVFMSLLGFGKGVGKALADLLFGFFGFSAWLYPAWLFLYGVLLITRKGGRQRLPRMLSLLLLLVVVQTAAHLKLHVTNEISLETPFDASETFRLCAKIQGGGGVIGGWIARILYRIFGLVVSGILLAALAVAGIIQVFRFSPAGFLRRRRRRAREAASDFHERRGFYRQQRLEELDREEEEALDRQAERILRREDELERRAQARRERETARRVRRRSAGSGMDLEEIRVLDPGRRTRTRSRRPETETSGNRINPAAAPARRDVHEITVLTTETKDPLTIPAVDRRGTGSSSPGTVPVRPVRARGDSPEPDGTRFERSSTSSAPRAASLPPETNRPKDPGTETAFTAAGSGTAPGRASTADSGSGSGLTAAAGGGTAAGEAAAAGSGSGFGMTAAAGTGSAAGETAASGSVSISGLTAAAGGGPAAGETAAAGSLPDAGMTAAGEQPELQEISVHREKNNPKTGPVGRTAHSGRGSTYTAPPFDLLKKGSRDADEETDRELKDTAHLLEDTLRTFGVQVTITDISRGPSVTRYELMPDQGVKVSRIVNLSDDIKLRLAATDIRIEAPIPGKSAIGIEVPNKHNSTVQLRDILESREFRRYDGKLPFSVGKDIAGKIIIADIARMPHLLIAGATGSGKSVCINTVILSILYKTSPDQVRLLMIDPKVVELSVYKKIPHLIIPVVTDPRKASAALNWAVAEMENRYKLFAAAGVRDLNGYNALAEEWRQKIEAESGVSVSIKQGAGSGPLPRLVIIVDELADLMMVSKSEVESSICRLAQLARAAGIHLIIATQRPSVDVITGLIKANMPSRIAFAVSSQVDSRTILDMTGAEKLIGKGDMLFYPQNYQKPARIQGAFVSDEEVIRVVKYISTNNASQTRAQEDESGEIARQIENIEENGMPVSGAEEVKSVPGRDEYFADAGRFIIEKNKASIGLLQRVFKIGFNRAARIMDQLAEAGVVSEESSTRARQVLMTIPEFENYLENET